MIRDPQGKFLTQAVLSTNLNLDPCQILLWFVRRWRVEVTFHEVRTHLGVETQRQWSDAAITRTTPTLLGLFSLVTFLAHQSSKRKQLPIRQAAWWLNDFLFFRSNAGLGPVMDTQLSQHRMHVEFNRPLGQDELFGDLGIGAAFGHQPENIHFSGG